MNTDKTANADVAEPRIESNRMADRWVLPLEDAPLWDAFFDPSLLQNWASQVADCIRQNAARQEWALTGPNLLVEYDDPADSESMLCRAALDAGLNAVRVPSSVISEAAGELRGHLAHLAPVLAIIEWGPWALEAETDVTPAQVTTIRRVLQAFHPDAPVLFAACANALSEVRAELLKAGAFDRVLCVQKPTPHFVGQRFLRNLGQGMVDETMASAPAKVGLLLMTAFGDSDSQALATLRLQRQARQERRQITLADLAELTIRGTHESSLPKRRPVAESSRKRTAYHEAGHACVAIIASGGKNVPDYASIVPAKEFDGVVLESLSFHESRDDFTYADLQLKARILLAGRAGEELLCGPSEVTSGATSDLFKATRVTYMHFAYSGFHSGMDSGESSGSSLAVLHDEEANEPFQRNRINRDVRKFLSNQYAYVVKVIHDHQAFVEAVAARLLWDPVIDQSEMTEIARQHGVLPG